MNDKTRRAPCAECGHSHRALGIEIRDRVLLRTARASAHMVKQFGGAWAFAARVWDAHSAEIHRVQVLDTESGTLYHADIDTVIRYAFRRVLDVRAGEQIILPLRYWKQLDTRSGPHDGATLADVTPQMETAQALTMTPAARPVFGDARMIAALRRAHRR